MLSLLYGPALTSIHDYWKNQTFDDMNLCWQVMSLLFNSLSRFVIIFLPRSKHLWLFCLLSLDIFTITQTHLAQTPKSLWTGWSLFLDCSFLNCPLESLLFFASFSKMSYRSHLAHYSMLIVLKYSVFIENLLYNKANRSGNNYHWNRAHCS